jgi:hypothetical protein
MFELCRGDSLLVSIHVMHIYEKDTLPSPSTSHHETFNGRLKPSTFVFLYSVP